MEKLEFVFFAVMKNNVSTPINIINKMSGLTTENSEKLWCAEQFHLLQNTEKSCLLILDVHVFVHQLVHRCRQ